MRTILFILGLILFLFSIPSSGTMFMEKLYDREMNNKYRITEINEMYKGAPTTYKFANTYINVYHLSKNHELYRDPWDYLIDVSDVYISIDGITEEVLEEYPVKVGEEGLNLYNHYVSYWLVEDKQTSEQSFVMVLQMNGAKEKELPDGSIEGFVPQEELKYLAITIQEDGSVTKENFTYENKNKLQTKLIPPMLFGGAGYYTDAWFSYPVLFFPLLYPFLTTILGLILILVGFPYKYFTRRSIYR